ncbi:ParB/RepB/Spo0J family partition protein [Planctomyces sp. SH-PL62]|uniref:ParB/RepB/Spo0J family partition protein n=1 Tax=Planctomyces sp. SH-PL62 TaxID=1636152 RepID=UPI00078E0687|nr:ParB/RepB/Spo0J family partition protein [Planctomyces sp. SH-PL62]AMV40247.1 Chromosome-partitioning protein Spo0J [Planctomyces sp. SH-PL62]
MNTQLIEVKKLAKSPLNVRRTGNAAACDELKASIRAHGLLQNLSVHPAKKGKFQVFAGGRRLAALHALQSEGHLPDDYAVPCHIYTEAQAQELSLAENTVRHAMHPADECEAFARLAGQGLSSADIATRFGVEEAHVLKRLKLARVAPELLSAYRAGEISLECLMAFTLTDDHKRQVSVYRGLSEWQRNARDIRALLTETMPSGKDRLAVFVGLDAYQQAGGIIRADLFGEAVYLENPELLHRIAAERMEAERQALLAEGWAWVEIMPERDWQFLHQCSRITPKPLNVPEELLERQARAESELNDILAALDDTESEALIEAQEAAEAALEAIAAELARFTAYDPEQMQLAGCCLIIGHNGALEVEKGLLLKGDAKRLAAPCAHAKGAAGKMPDSLRRDLEAYRLQVAQAAIAGNPALAFDWLAFTLVRDAFGQPISTGLDIRLIEHRGKFDGAGDTAAANAMEAIRQGLPRHWLEPEEEAEQFRQFRAMPETAKHAIFAFCVAQSLQPQLSTGHEATAYEQAMTLTGVEVAAFWRPGKAQYLKRLTRAQLLALGAELVGEAWAYQRMDYKKTELVERLDAAFREPEQPGHSAEAAAKLAAWLPEGMAFLPREAEAAEPVVEPNAIGVEHAAA